MNLTEYEMGEIRCLLQDLRYYIMNGNTYDAIEELDSLELLIGM